MAVPQSLVDAAAAEITTPSPLADALVAQLVADHKHFVNFKLDDGWVCMVKTFGELTHGVATVVGDKASATEVIADIVALHERVASLVRSAVGVVLSRVGEHRCGDACAAWCEHLSVLRVLLKRDAKTQPWSGSRWRVIEDDEYAAAYVPAAYKVKMPRHQSC